MNPKSTDELALVPHKTVPAGLWLLLLDSAELKDANMFTVSALIVENLCFAWSLHRAVGEQKPGVSGVLSADDIALAPVAY